MPIKLSPQSFIKMPWKNGLGVTTEIFKKEDKDFCEDFVFRLSVAQVKADGSFSIFKDIKRTLLILKGRGIILESETGSTRLNTDSAPFHFDGEEGITGKLIEGEITDFNVMIHRNWGQAQTTRTRNVSIPYLASDYVFLFDPKSQNLLIYNQGENIELAFEHQWIMITLTLHSVSNTHAN